MSEIYVRRDGDRLRVTAQTRHKGPGLEEKAQTWAAKFGDRPRGIRCPSAVFAFRYHEFVYVVGQAADLGDGPNPPLGFRFLLIDRRNYPGDPFVIADRFPPNWNASGDLDPLDWPAEPLPRRAVDDLQRLLKAGDSSLLLGGAQALLDGSKVLLESPAPDADTVRALWQLLPDSVRHTQFPATFAFGNDLGFDLVVLPPDGGLEPRRLPGYLTADQARDYPEGRYELALQTAIEAGDQRELDRLFARRSSQDTLRLAVTMLVLAVTLAVVVKVLF
ncbi:MAG: hypothetical protein U0871_24080 [Gemmataceae bacterium]